MNERIKELAEQCATPERFDVAKFAELIVEECRYVMDCNKGSDQHTEWNRALFETSEKIKEHFGVEL
jgi:hypothetical protein